VTTARRLSQAISEGDGISVIVHVDDVDEALAAEEQGAEGLALVRSVEGIGEATTLPVLWLGDPSAVADVESCGAHALTVWADEGDERLRELQASLASDMELVVGVANEEELEVALEVEAEIFLLSGGEADGDQHPLDRVLELLPDVPAGKLAIAAVAADTRDEVVALERAGFDAVLVPAGHVGDLVGGTPPQV
jgi:indole-3-glycerol phosphate synthase